MGSFGTPEGCNGGFYKNRKQADDNILGNPQQHEGQSKKYTLCTRALYVYTVALVPCLGSDQTPDPQNIDFF